MSFAVPCAPDIFVKLEVRSENFGLATKLDKGGKVFLRLELSAWGEVEEGSAHLAPPSGCCAWALAHSAMTSLTAMMAVSLMAAILGSPDHFSRSRSRRASTAA